MRSLYRIALIQNASEMMRFGWADIRPAIRHLEYSLDAYTDENVEALIEPLRRRAYDALVLATNSCNSIRVLACLRDNKDVIATYLDTGGGLFLSYQAKLGQEDRFGFLPDTLEIRAITRDRKEEKTTAATLAFGVEAQEHPVACFPHKLDLTDITARCRRNALVEGVYWAYLNPLVPESYNTLVCDEVSRPERPIIIVSRPTTPARIIASTIVADWQGHDTLFENVIRYVTEGRPAVALVSREGRETKSFRYLTVSLGIKKVPFAHYTLTTLDDVKQLPKGLHDCAVFAPSWSREDIAAAQNIEPLVGSGKFTRGLYFDHLGNRDVSLSILSRRSEFQRISRNAITWLRATYDEQKLPYWGASFWTTTDVLQTLSAFEQPIDQYVEPLLREIDRHDIDGSYDEVLGTSAALLELYHLLLGKKHDRFRRTKEWVKTHIDGKDLHERATAIAALKRLGESVAAKPLERLKADMLSVRDDLRNEFSLQRFIKTLVTCGFPEDAKPLARTLNQLQNSSDGTWVNIANTAATVETLLELQRSLRKPEEWIDEMIFLGVLACRRAYTEQSHNWSNDPLATAKCLRALAAFEQHIEFAVDEAIWSLEGVNREAQSIVAIDSTSRANVRLQRTNNDLVETVRNLTKKSTGAKWLAAVSATIATFLLLVIGAIALHVTADEKRDVVMQVMGRFLASKSVWFFSAVALLPIGVLLLILAYLQLLPGWVTTLLEWVGISKPEATAPSGKSGKDSNGK